MERRYHNPYRHWLAGLLTEISVFAGTLVLFAIASLLAAWWAR